MRLLIAFVICFSTLVGTSTAKEFNITDYGATAGDETDDSTAIENALAACGEAGGGTVFIPAGTFFLSRRNNESPILEVPPKLFLPPRWSILFVVVNTAHISIVPRHAN